MVFGGGRMESHSRKFLWVTLLIFLVGCQSQAASSVHIDSTPSPHVGVASKQDYAVHEQLTLVNDGPGQPTKQNIWVALIRDFPPYQEVGAMEISSPNYTPIVDEYGNRYAEFDFSGQPSGTTQTVTIDYRVTVNELIYDLTPCQGELPDIFNKPELHIEAANPQIVALSEQLSRDKGIVCQQVRAFYDYIDDNLVYTFNGANWGAQVALGPMGADCTEYSDLLVALSRSRGIPARYFEGLLYLDKASGDLANLEHAWPDVYLPGTGWVALDPTLGRSPVNRDKYYAHYTANHIIVTLGASPSVLRGGSYWTHLYWPGNSTKIKVSGDWKIELVEAGKP
jgi:transglutaminase-like putative cysteine protease